MTGIGCLVSDDRPVSDAWYRMPGIGCLVSDACVLNWRMINILSCPPLPYCTVSHDEKLLWYLIVIEQFQSCDVLSRRTDDIRDTMFYQSMLYH